jgi:hypothetical protein
MYVICDVHDIATGEIRMPASLKTKAYLARRLFLSMNFGSLPRSNVRGVAMVLELLPL